MFISPAVHCRRGLHFNLHPVFEDKPHIILAVDRHEIHHGVPGCLVKIIHLFRQAPHRPLSHHTSAYHPFRYFLLLQQNTVTPIDYTTEKFLFLSDGMKRLFFGNGKQKKSLYSPYHFPIFFLPLYSYTIWRNPYTFRQNYRLLPNYIGVCQIVRGLPNRMRFCQKVSLTPNCIRLSPNRLYFLAKEPQNRSSPTLECKNASKNTRK